MSTVGSSTGDTVASDVTFNTAFSTALANQLKITYGLRLSDVSTETIATGISSVINNLLPTEINLSTVRPDYDSVLVRFMREIEKGDAWKDTSLSSFGQMLLRTLATDVDLAQFSIMRALQECYPSTARNASSIITNARDQGIEIQRAVGASFSVAFTRPDVGLSYQVPLWSQFQTDFGYWFNRLPITFGINDITVNADLTEGQLFSETVTSTGVAFQAVEVGQENGKISDVDVRVIVDGIEWTRTESSLWNLLPTDQVFYLSTLPNSDVEIRFGNGVFGTMPGASVSIQVIWAETLGTAGNEPRTGLPVNWPAAPSGVNITGVSLTAANNGVDALSTDYYRIFSGDRRGADAGNAKRAVLRKDFRAHACTFPGVFDAVFRGQAEMGSHVRSLTNVIGVTLLTDPVFTAAQWDDFVDFMQSTGDQEGGLCLANLKLLRIDPTPIVVNFSGTLGVSPDADPAAVEGRVLNLLSSVLAPKIGTLGYGFYETDFSNILRGYLPPQFKNIVDARSLRIYDLPSLIEYVDMVQPTADVLPINNLSWVKMGTFDFNTLQVDRNAFNGHF